MTGLLIEPTRLFKSSQSSFNTAYVPIYILSAVRLSLEGWFSEPWLGRLGLRVVYAGSCTSNLFINVTETNVGKYQG